MRSRFEFLSVNVLVLLSFGAVLLATAGCDPSTKELRTEGITQFRQRQTVESMATMRHVLRLDPNDAEANYYMGLNYRALAERQAREDDVQGAYRSLDEAILYFTQAIKTWPNYMAAVQAKTEALDARGKYEKAIEVAERVSENNRGIAEHFIFLGDQYRARADYDNALRAYQTAESASPKNAQVYLSIGKLYVQVGNRELAIEAFRKAQQLDPNSPDAGDMINELQSNQAEYSSHQPPVLEREEPTVAPRSLAD